MSLPPAPERKKKPARYFGIEFRLQIFAVALAGALGVLLYQLWNLQVVRQAEFKEQAEANMLRPQRLKSDRGIIYGRNDVIIADNRAATDIVFVPGECPKEQREEVAARIEKLLGVPQKNILAQADKFKHEPFTQIVLKQDAAHTDVVRVEEFNRILPGVITIARPQRRYHFGATGGQLLGYLGEISEGELAQWSDFDYQMGDIIGKSGIERQYERLLQGVDGFMLVTKYAAGRPQLRTNRHGLPIVAAHDSRGQELDEFQRKDPEPGAKLHLTLDMDFQHHCEELLRQSGYYGAIVVLDADTGGVYAMASNPTYDPSVFVTRGTSRERMALLEDTANRPMENRGYRNHYPPGSTFKIVVAAAGLEEKIINEHTTFYCPGSFQLGGKGYRWRCWLRGGHGTVNVVDALAYSCDVFFYQVGSRLGVERIAKWSNRFGLGVPTGIDLPDELPGLIPTPEWKRLLNADKKNEWEKKWYPGETVNLSIGQGDANSTPLQCATMMAAVIGDGFRVIPHLNADVAQGRGERLMSDESLRIVRDGLRKCVADGPPAPSGTGRPAYIEGMDILGKTGTAQNVSLSFIGHYASTDQIPYKMRHHAWFVAGVLDRTPRIAICILLEHGHSGGKVAAPFGHDVISYFYNREGAKPMLARADEGDE